MNYIVDRNLERLWLTMSSDSTTMDCFALSHSGLGSCFELQKREREKEKKFMISSMLKLSCSQ